MAVGERERRELQEALVDTIGPDQTDTLLGYLPPTGWADVATKHDLEELRVATKHDLEVLEAKFDDKIAALRADVLATLNKQMWATVSLIVAVLLAVIGTGIFG